MCWTRPREEVLSEEPVASARAALCSRSLVGAEATAGDAGVTLSSLSQQFPFLCTQTAFAKEALLVGSTGGRYFEILGQAQAKVFVSFKAGPKFFKHDSCCCCCHYLSPKGYTTLSLFLTRREEENVPWQQFAQIHPLRYMPRAITGPGLGLRRSWGSQPPRRSAGRNS